MNGNWKGIKTAYPAHKMPAVRKFLMSNKYKGFRLGPFMTSDPKVSNVMVYTDEQNWLMFVLKNGKVMDDVMALHAHFDWPGKGWTNGWPKAGPGFKQGEMTVISTGRGMGKSKFEELYLNEVFKDRDSSDRTVYANFEASAHRSRVLEI